MYIIRSKTAINVWPIIRLKVMLLIQCKNCIGFYNHKSYPDTLDRLVKYGYMKRNTSRDNRVWYTLTSKGYRTAVIFERYHFQY